MGVVGVTNRSNRSKVSVIGRPLNIPLHKPTASNTSLPITKTNKTKLIFAIKTIYTLACAGSAPNATNQTNPIQINACHAMQNTSQSFFFYHQLITAQPQSKPASSSPSPLPPHHPNTDDSPYHCDATSSPHHGDHSAHTHPNLWRLKVS